MAREALAVADGTRAVRSAHLAHHFLADYSLIPGDCAGALPRYRRSLATAVELRDRSEIVAEVQGIAMAMAGCGESGRALQLAAAAAAEFDAPAIDLSGMPFGIALLDGYLGIARVALGEAVPNAAWQDGQHTRFEHAIMLALDTESSPVLAASLEKLARAAT